jgi:hypothetical protein
MTPHEDGMVDINNMNGSITVGNGQTMMTVLLCFETFCVLASMLERLETFAEFS